MNLWERLRSAFTGERGAVSRSRSVVGSEPVIQQLPLSLQFSRIGGNLTPAVVSDIIREADMGIMYRLIDLGNEARQKDCHLQSALYTRESAVAQLKWQIVPAMKPGRKNPLAKDEKIAHFVNTALHDAIPPGAIGGVSAVGFAEALAHLAGAPFAGYAASETLWVKRAGYIVPQGFSPISPRRFRFDQQTGVLQWWDVSGGAGTGIDLAAMYPGRFIQHQPRITGDVACREGLIRVLMWAALLRNWTIRDWMTLAELAWKPWRTGQYQKGASQEDIDNLANVLVGMSGSGIATYPDTTDVKIEWPKNAQTGNSAHGELAAFLGAEMSKAILGQTLTTEAGARGARSLGQVHDQVRKDIREADARSLAATLRRDLVAPIVRLNFGPDVAIPGFAFLTEDAADLVSFSTGIEKLVGVGARIPAVWVADRAGYPMPEEGEEIIGEGEDIDVSELDEPAPETPPEPTDEAQQEAA